MTCCWVFKELNKEQMNKRTVKQILIEYSVFLALCCTFRAEFLVLFKCNSTKNQTCIWWVSFVYFKRFNVYYIAWKPVFKEKLGQILLEDSSVTVLWRFFQRDSMYGAHTSLEVCIASAEEVIFRMDPPISREIYDLCLNIFMFNR